jgi:hypothetical protein
MSLSVPLDYEVGGLIGFEGVAGVNYSGSACHECSGLVDHANAFR